AWVGGIRLEGSDSNTVSNNTCNNNIYGIYLGASYYNTVANNNCSSNEYGIYLEDSHSNTVTSNTCNNNGVTGIYLEDSYSNTVANKTCLTHDSQHTYLFLLDSNSADILEEQRILWFNGSSSCAHLSKTEVRQTTDIDAVFVIMRGLKWVKQKE
ncbi:MAG: NosD domain-containing protein, partial [Promethearchaeota archaeon]